MVAAEELVAVHLCLVRLVKVVTGRRRPAKQNTCQSIHS